MIGSVIGSPNVQDYFRFNTRLNIFFSKQSEIMLPYIGLKNQTFVILLTNYADRRIVLKNSVHYMEIPTLMWVSSGANLSTT
jgi:hypothetical protein